MLFCVSKCTFPEHADCSSDRAYNQNGLTRSFIYYLKTVHTRYGGLLTSYLYLVIDLTFLTIRMELVVTIDRVSNYGCGHIPPGQPVAQKSRANVQLRHRTQLQGQKPEGG